eukprot:3926275-Pyramimonas_sp.AAC.1
MVAGRSSRNLAEANAHKVISILMDDFAAPFETVDGQKMNHVFHREDSIAFNSNKPWGYWQLRIFLKPTVA